MLRLYVQITCTIFLIRAEKLPGPLESTNYNVECILSQFPDYNFIVHFDNATEGIFEELIKYVQVPQIVINYDVKNIQSRPHGYKFLNIIFLKNFLKFEKFSSDHSNIQQDDVLLFLIHSAQSTELWFTANIRQAHGLLIYALQTKRLQYVCFFCGSNSKRLQEIVPWNYSRIRKYMNDYSNFYGYNFRIGYISFVPFFWCQETGSACSGPEANLLRLLSDRLNFSYTLVNFEHTPSAKGIWQTLIDGVHNKSFDWGVGGISLTPERSNLTDITRVIHSEDYTILYHCHTSETWSSWKQVSRPFSFLVWVCILLVFIVILILLRHLPDSTKTDTVKLFQILVRGLLEQPSSRLPVVSMTKRIILIAWLYTCIILITAYKSKVVSMMISSESKQFDSIQELLQQGYTFQVSNQDWSVLQENWGASSKIDKSFQEILEKTNDDLTTCNVVEKMLKKKVAYIDETSTILFQITTCKAFQSREDLSSQLCFIKKKVFPSYHIWPLQLGAAYRHRFSDVIEDLHSAGILVFWYKSILEQLLTRSPNVRATSNTDGLTLTTMAPSLLVLGLGLGVGLFSFVIEIMYYHSESISKILKRFSF